MQIIQDHDPKVFVDRVQPMLLERECENCWQLGAIRRLCLGKAVNDFSPIMLTIESEGRIEGIAMQTFSLAMVVTPLTHAAADVLIQKLRELHWPGNGFSAAPTTSDLLAERWCAASGKSKHLHGNLRVFQLTTMSPPNQVAGFMLPASTDHLDLLTQWHDDFCRYINEPDPHPRQSTQHRIDERQLFVWEYTGQLRSMAAVAGPTPHGIRINNVYTPPQYRGRGYASNLVAALSSHQLASGKKFCFLFTDLANPTSNKIYQRIGYQPVSDFRLWRFD